jgi:hypothetical protein
MVSAFTTAVLASLPPSIVLPAELATTLDWLEDNGHVVDRGRGPFAGVHPVSDPAVSAVAFHPSEPDFMRFWLGQEGADDRIVAILRTGADGSHAALWLDPDGVQRIVHLGSGSGSTAIGILVENPVDLLRLMAIGYVELCSPETYGLTPEKVLAAERGDDLGAFRPPTSFQDFVRDTFGVSIPARASEVVGELVNMDDDEVAARDPFGAWLAQLRR